MARVTLQSSLIPLYPLFALQTHLQSSRRGMAIIWGHISHSKISRGQKNTKKNRTPNFDCQTTTYWHLADTFTSWALSKNSFKPMNLINFTKKNSDEKTSCHLAKRAAILLKYICGVSNNKLNFSLWLRIVYVNAADQGWNSLGSSKKFKVTIQKQTINYRLRGFQNPKSFLICSWLASGRGSKLQKPCHKIPWTLY